MKDKILLGAIVAGAASPAQAATLSGVTCDPSVIADIQSILSLANSPLLEPLPACQSVVVDLDPTYDAGDVPEDRFCVEEEEGQIYVFTGPDSEASIRAMITGAGLPQPASGALRLTIVGALIYDEEDFPDHLCDGSSGPTY